jgi:hypothetical protein
MIGNYTAPYNQNPNMSGSVLSYNLTNGTGGNTASYEDNQMSFYKAGKRNDKRNNKKKRKSVRKSKRRSKRTSTGKRSKK